MKMEKANVPFTMIANEVLANRGLSLKAKGLYAYLFSKPDGWQFSAKRMTMELKESHPTILGCLRELEDANLLQRHKRQSGRVDYFLAFAVSQSKETLPSAESKNAKVKESQLGKVLPISNTDEKVIKKEESNILATQSVADAPSPINEVMECFKEVNPSYERLYANKTQRAALDRLIKKHGAGKIKRSIAAASQCQGQPYAPTITTPLQLEERLGSLIAFYKKQGARGPALVKL